MSLEKTANAANKIEELFDKHINPMLAMHGGSAKLISIDSDTIARIEFSGGCRGCAGARMTLGRYITAAIKHVAPSIIEVVDATDHSTGENPYYKPEDL